MKQMISLVTVFIDTLDKYLPYLEESIIKKTKLINEVLIPRVDTNIAFYKEWTKRGITFKTFGARNSLIMDFHSPALHCLHHALGLHLGIDAAKNNYIMMCDPDIFFLSDLDVFYIDLINRFKLNYIGLSHPAALTQSFTFFPNVLNCLVKKSDLPDDNFLKNDLTLYTATPEDLHQWKEYDIANRYLRGKFLVPSRIPGTEEYFPNPKGYYETGCQLVIWAKQKNWRWLSFQTPDCLNYTSQYARANFKITERIEKRKLLYHVMHGAAMKERFDIYVESYNRENED